jgi:hypothetical protein
MGTRGQRTAIRRGVVTWGHEDNGTHGGLCYTSHRGLRMTGGMPHHTRTHQMAMATGNVCPYWRNEGRCKAGQQCPWVHVQEAPVFYAAPQANPSYQTQAPEYGGRAVQIQTARRSRSPRRQPRSRSPRRQPRSRSPRRRPRSRSPRHRTRPRSPRRRPRSRSPRRRSRSPRRTPYERRTPRMPAAGRLPVDAKKAGQKNCSFFMRGSCSKGDACTFKHPGKCWQWRDGACR